MADNSKAPGELDHIRAFVNTYDVEDGEDSLREPADLRDWLAERQLLAGGDSIAESDLRQARDVREALRLLLLANNGASVEAAAVETLNSAAKSAELAVRFGSEGGGSLSPVRSGFDGALARLLSIVYGAIAEGTWPRLKACACNDCEVAFYDTSKNRSRTWCDMAVCGNREKARAYRQRRRQG